MNGIAGPTAAWAVAQACHELLEEGGRRVRSGPTAKNKNFPTSPRILTSVRSRDPSQSPFRALSFNLFFLRGFGTIKATQSAKKQKTQ